MLACCCCAVGRIFIAIMIINNIIHVLQMKRRDLTLLSFKKVSCKA